MYLLFRNLARCNLTSSLLERILQRTTSDNLPPHAPKPTTAFHTCAMIFDLVRRETKVGHLKKVGIFLVFICVFFRDSVFLFRFRPPHAPKTHFLTHFTPLPTFLFNPSTPFHLSSTLLERGECFFFFFLKQSIISPSSYCCTRLVRVVVANLIF